MFDNTCQRIVYCCPVFYEYKSTTKVALKLQKTKKEYLENISLNVFGLLMSASTPSPSLMFLGWFTYIQDWNVTFSDNVLRNRSPSVQYWSKNSLQPISLVFIGPDEYFF